MPRLYFKKTDSKSKEQDYQTFLKDQTKRFGDMKNQPYGKRNNKPRSQNKNTTTDEDEYSDGFLSEDDDYSDDDFDDIQQENDNRDDKELKPEFKIVYKKRDGNHYFVKIYNAEKKNTCYRIIAKKIKRHTSIQRKRSTSK